MYAGLVTGAFISVCTLGVLHLRAVTESCEGLQDEQRSDLHPHSDSFRHVESAQRAMDPDASSFPTTTTVQAPGGVYADDNADPVVADQAEAQPPEPLQPPPPSVTNSTYYTLVDPTHHARARVRLEESGRRAVMYAQATAETRSGVAVVDYSKHSVSLYILDDTDRCFVMRGFDELFPRYESLRSILKNNSMAEPGRSPDVLVLSVAHNLRDVTELAGELGELCWAKDVLLLQPATDAFPEDGTEAMVALPTGDKTLILVVG